MVRYKRVDRSSLVEIARQPDSQTVRRIGCDAMRCGEGVEMSRYSEVEEVEGNSEGIVSE